MLLVASLHANMKETVLRWFLLVAIASWVAAEVDYNGGPEEGEIDYDVLNGLFNVREARAAAAEMSGSGDGTQPPPCSRLRG